jgi:hypothetical protein
MAKIERFEDLIGWQKAREPNHFNMTLDFGR